MDKKEKLKENIGDSTVRLAFQGKRIKHVLYFLGRAVQMLMSGKTFVHFKQKKELTP